MITPAQKAYLLALKPDDLTFDKLVELFGDTVKLGEDISKEKKSMFSTTDELTLEPSEYFVKTHTLTTVGRFIFNKYLIERMGFQDITGYVNYPLTTSGYNKMESSITAALINDRITVEEFRKYMDYRDTLGMQLNSVITTSFTWKTIQPLPAVERRKKELFKQYEKELAAGDILVSEKIEKELVALARKELEGDPGLDLYNSEARGNFGNYKNMNIFKGATLNNGTGEYEIVKSSFLEGIRKEDLASFGDAVISGSYPKAVGTQVSGYMSKQLLASMQSESLDEPGTDCGTKSTIKLKLTQKNCRDYEYRYIMVNGKPICLDETNMPKYIDKEVNLRSPMYCTGDKICNVCGGQLEYMLGKRHVGLGTSRISNALLKLGMKKFHTANIKSKPIDVNDMFI